MPHLTPEPAAGVVRDVQLNGGPIVGGHGYGVFDVVSTGTFRASSTAGIGHGNATGAATLLTSTAYNGVPSGAGATIAGLVGSANVTNDYVHMYASGPGSVARGRINAAETVGSGNARLYSSGVGSIASGFIGVSDTALTPFNAYLKSTSAGSIAMGSIRDRYGKLYSQGAGSIAVGEVAGQNSYLYSSATGSIAAGKAGNTALTVAGNIRSYGNGSLAMGYSNGGYIKATSTGAFAQGEQNGSYYIRATAPGAMARGRSTGGTIEASSSASTAIGDVVSGAISSSGDGSFAMGKVTNTGYIYAQANGAFSVGAADNSGRILGLQAGCLAVGYSRYNGYIRSGSGIAINKKGCFTGGYANASYMDTQRNGAFAFGCAYSQGRLLVTGAGASAMGYVNNGYIRATADGATARGRSYGDIHASGFGAFAGGDSQGGPSPIVASGAGSFAFGYGRNSGGIYATGLGSCAIGYAYNTSQVRAQANGAFACGNAYGFNVEATAKGAWAGGWARSNGITASGYGSMAFGYSSGGLISTKGYKGAMALGYAGINIYCQAYGAVQFHGGTNDNYESVAVGTQLRLASHSPTTKRGGDIWADSGGGYIYMYGQTAGYNWKSTYQCAKRSYVTTGVTTAGNFTYFNIQYGLITSAS
jgi:hypothetical protein